MAEKRVQRKLAAILAADVVGYSRMMGLDEEGTLAALNAHRTELIDPAIAGHRGRIFKTTGDGMLVEFASVVDAVRCAIVIQQAMVEREAGTPEDRKIVFRIGVNLGDVIPQDDDIYGDGVNIAARLEGLAEPGGICISRTVRDNIRDRLEVALEELGEIDVKNIARPVRAFRVLFNPAMVDQFNRRSKTRQQIRRISILAVILLLLVSMGFVVSVQPWKSETSRAESSLSAGTSIAVLPFVNLSGNADQEYFSDGMTNDLITDLSKFQDLFVISSNSVFAYKGKSVKVQQVGRELKVRYVLEGSIQRSGNRVRINVQLVDTVGGHQLWAERYDESVANLFDLQDRIRKRIVGALAVKLTRFEQRRALSKPTSDLKAYDYLLRGMRLLATSRRDDNFEAQRLFQLAIERDPDYGSAYAGLGKSLYETVLFGWTQDPQPVLVRVRELAEKAIERARSTAQGHGLLASVYLMRRQYDLALVEIERAIALNPNDSVNHATQGAVLLWSSFPQGAILSLETALRFDPHMGARSLSHLGLAYYLVGDYKKAIQVLERAVGLNPQFAYAHTILAATYGQVGNSAAAANSAKIVRSLDPFFTTRQFGHLFQDASDAASVIVGLRKAGLD